jgi:membrane protease YdiL (CAAX protease family)
VDETPQLPEQGAPPVVELGAAASEAAPPVEAHGGHPVTAKTLWRDAALDLLAALGVGLPLAVLAGIVAAIFAFAKRGTLDVQSVTQSPWAIAIMLLATQLPFLFFAIRRRKRNREKQRPLMELFAGPAGPAIGQGILVGFSMTVLSIVYGLGLQRVLGDDAVPNQLEFLQGALNQPWIAALLVVIVTVLAPVGEELFFRGVIFGSARAAGFTSVGVLISAVFFSLVHLNLLLTPFYATFAIVMCFLYARTRTLAAPIAAHMTLNGVACLVLLLAGDKVV